MRITNSPNAKHHTVLLEFDSGDQVILRNVCTLAKKTLRNPAVVKVLAQEGHTMTMHLAAGEKILYGLATTSERQSQLAIADLQTAGELVMFVVSFHATTRKPASVLSKAAVLLARVTPCPLPFLLLPPAAEVFDQSMSTSSIWEDFDFLRQKKDAEPPYLTLLRAYALWFALRNVEHNNAQLQTLLEYLETITRMFRLCMGSLVAAELADVKATKERSGRKP
jgi:hypothetical protein